MNYIKLNTRYVNSFQVKDIIPAQYLLVNPEKLKDILIKSRRDVLNCFIWVANQYQDIYISYETVASLTGLCVRTVQNAVHGLRELGLLNYVFRWNKTNLYRLSSWLYDFWVKKKLQGFLTQLKYFTSVFLMPDIASGSQVAYDIIKGVITSGLVCSKNDKVTVMKTKLHERLAKKLEITDPASVMRLEAYDDSVLMAAEQVLDKAKQHQTTVKSLSGYFFGTCKNIVAKQQQRPDGSDSRHSQDIIVRNQVKSPMYKPYVSQLDSAEVRKEKRANKYGETKQERKITSGFVHFMQLLSSTIPELAEYKQPKISEQPFIIKDEDHAWWSLQEPMDIDNFEFVDFIE